MPEKLRIEAVTCDERLKLLGRTITDATNHYLSHLAAVQRSCTVNALIREFIVTKVQDGASETYLKDLKHRLGKFEQDFGERLVADILSVDIDDWLRSLDVAAQTRNNYRTVIRTMFEFAVVRNYAQDNPTAKTAKAKVVRLAPEIFTPEQMRLVLEHAPAEFIPYLVIGGFAGLRSAEIKRLDWSEINLGRKLINVKAEKSKSAQRRLVDISDNLAAWLAPHVKSSGAVAKLVRDSREKTCKSAKIEWPSNALRHSFASYHLAHHQNAAITATQLGHTSPTMLYKHYREVVRPDEADKWWSILPPAEYGNIVAFSAKAVSSA